MADANQDTAQKAIDIVNQTLISEFELEPSAVVPEARMREDLRLDSLDAVDLIVALEKALKVQIPETEAREMRTVGDVHQYVLKRVSQGG
ncbi:MAG TPA: phosphopantetheine-binding protein [Myxococcus sp.]|jgi:acyl carrier protein|nr:phosphopantetheine-binding protein [Myxococcus sp.]